MAWNGFSTRVKNAIIILIAYLKNISRHHKITIMKRLRIFDQKYGFACHILVTMVKQPINFIVIYNTKKISYFVSNKDSVPNLSRSSLVYQFTCPGCNSKYVGKTDRCLSTRLTEHGKPHCTNINNNNSSSSIS